MVGLGHQRGGTVARRLPDVVGDVPVLELGPDQSGQALAHLAPRAVHNDGVVVAEGLRPQQVQQGVLLVFVLPKENHKLEEIITS